MKVKHAILLIAAGFCLGIIGAYLKIVHYGSASLLLLAAMLLKLAGVLLLVYKLLRHRGLHRFLNS